MKCNEVESFIVEQPRNSTYSELELAVRERFGAECGWDRKRIAMFWRNYIEAKPSTPSRLDQDPEVRDFVNDRLFRVTLDELRRACLAEFGADRTPSRSALHLYSQKVRKADKGSAAKAV